MRTQKRSYASRGDPNIWGASSSSSSQVAKRRPYGGAGGTVRYSRRSYQMPVYRRGETKYFDCGFSAAVTAAGTTWADTELPMDNYVNSSGAPAAYTDSCLIPTAIGSAYGQVDGNSFQLQKIRIRGNIRRSAPAADQADVLPPLTVRALLVMDTMPNGAQAQGEDVIQDFGEYNENTFAFQRVSATAGKFRVLKDETWSLPVVTAADNAAVGPFTSSQHTGQVLFNWKWQPRIPLKVNVKAGSATPTIASTINCNIFVLVYAMQGSAVTQVTVSGCSRCYYNE